MADAALMKALGGGKSKLPGWAKLLILVGVLALAWVLAWEWGLFLILVSFGGWTAWAWWHEKGNIVDSFRDFVLYSALLATAMGGPMSGIAGGFRGFGPAAVEAVKGRWNEAERNAPTVQVTPASPPATPPPPPAAP